MYVCMFLVLVLESGRSSRVESSRVGKLSKSSPVEQRKRVLMEGGETEKEQTDIKKESKGFRVCCLDIRVKRKNYGEGGSSSD